MIYLCLKLQPRQKEIAIVNRTTQYPNNTMLHVLHFTVKFIINQMITEGQLNIITNPTSL